MLDTLFWFCRLSFGAFVILATLLLAGGND